MNLIELSSKWLQKTDFSKSIQVRTKDVISKFSLHMQKKPDDFYVDSNLSREDTISVINDIKQKLEQLLNSYLDGNVMQAIDIAHELLTHINASHSAGSMKYYRARSNDSGFLYKKEEMFHIPYELRYKISNQRYSVSGLPCLYLASSTYLAWEELERPDVQKCNYCLLVNKNDLYYFDICIPMEIITVEDIYRTCIALACSLKTQKEHIFKLEYIVPQCLLHSVVADQHFAHDGIGIRYYSVPFLYKEASTFRIDWNDPACTSRFVNIVIPAQSPKRTGLSPLLVRMFKQSPTMSMMHRYLLNEQPQSDKIGINDTYSGSQFGMLENHLDNMLNENNTLSRTFA